MVTTELLFKHVIKIFGNNCVCKIRDSVRDVHRLGNEVTQKERQAMNCDERVWEIGNKSEGVSILPRSAEWKSATWFLFK